VSALTAAGVIDQDALEAILERSVDLIGAHERDGVFPRDEFEEVARAGVFRAAFSERHEDQLEYFEALTRLAKGWVSLSESVHLQVLAMRGVFNGGKSELVDAIGNELLDGTAVLGNCFSEANAGSDLSAIDTVAVRDGDDYLISGDKMWVGHATVARYLSVWCRSERPDVTGLTGFLVPADAPGVEVGVPVAKMGARALPTAPVRFRSVRAPRSQMLGRPHRGLLVANHMLNWGRLGIASCAVGLAEAALERAVSYAKQRRQFGKPVIDNQGLAFGLADVATNTAAARAIVTDAVRRTIDGQGSTRITAQAKLFATDNAMNATSHAVQVLSAYGYLDEEPVSRWFREAKLFQIIDGTNHLQRQMIASTL
jgi:alkylation response protein AidB-like acyl-CoA dehydrogenase